MKIQIIISRDEAKVVIKPYRLEKDVTVRGQVGIKCFFKTNVDHPEDNRQSEDS
jgi:hypothetical protein